MIDFNTISVLPLNSWINNTKEKIQQDFNKLNLQMNEKNYTFTILTIPKDISLNKPKIQQEDQDKNLDNIELKNLSENSRFTQSNKSGTQSESELPNSIISD
jgi:hypothetical protein